MKEEAKVNNKNISIPYITVAPNIRDDISQDVWQAMPWHSDFIVFCEPEFKSNPQTSFALAHDGQRIYVAIKMLESQCDRLSVINKSIISTTDTSVLEHGEDRIQIMMDMAATGETCALVAANSKGVVTTAWGTALDKGCVPRPWNVEIDYNVQVKKDHWSIQFSVPLNAFQYSSLSSQHWLLNIVRRRQLVGETHEFSVFSSLRMVHFWMPQSLSAQVNIESPEHLAKVLWSSINVGGARPSMKEGNVCCLGIEVTNHSTQAQDVVIETSYQGIGNNMVQKRSQSALFAPGQQQMFDVKIDKNEQEYGYMTIDINSASSGLLNRNCIFVDCEPLNMKPHWIHSGDGQGGLTSKLAHSRLLSPYNGLAMWPSALAKMDNNEIILLGVAHDRDGLTSKIIVCFSSDEGDSWSNYQEIRNINGRPLMLTYLGSGRLSFASEDSHKGVFNRFISTDYGRTWKEYAEGPRTADNMVIYNEGNNWVERDADGNVEVMYEIGYARDPEKPWPVGLVRAYFMKSYDRGQTWETIYPKEWILEEQYAGEVYHRGCCEGSIVRASNGWLVAALRTDIPACYLRHPFANDNLSATMISISKDDGKTWSAARKLLEPGRHHANLIRLANNDLVMTFICRKDMKNGRLVSYKQGCQAIVSHDNGLNWNVERMYDIDTFTHCSDNWIWAECGHISSLLLNNNTLLTTYTNYLFGGIMLKWNL